MQNPGRFTQLKVHLARLVDLELVSAHRVEHGSFLYELAWDGSAGRDGGRFMVGVTGPTQPSLPLAEPEIQGYDPSRSGSEVVRSGAGRPLVGARSAGGRTGLNGSQPNTGMASRPTPVIDSQERADTAGTTGRVIDQPSFLSAVGGA
jgi:DNA primase